MSNMSYCRFENTYRDLEDCLDALIDGKELSESEQRHKQWLIELCCRIAEEYGNE